MRKAAYLLSFLVLVSFSITAAAPCDAVTKKWAQKNLENKAKGKVYPTWTIFQEGTAKSVTWQTNQSNPRFAIYDLGTGGTGDDLVLDKETGLVWERRVNTGTRSWSASLSACYSLEKGERLGWRLPTLEELGSLVDKDESVITLPAGHPFEDLAATDYWTATVNAGDPGYAWYVDLSNGAMAGALKGTNKRTWCVRGGVLE